MEERLLSLGNDDVTVNISNIVQVRALQTDRLSISFKSGSVHQLDSSMGWEFENLCEVIWGAGGYTVRRDPMGYLVAQTSLERKRYRCLDDCPHDESSYINMLAHSREKGHAFYDSEDNDCAIASTSQGLGGVHKSRLVTLRGEIDRKAQELHSTGSAVLDKYSRRLQGAALDLTAVISAMEGDIRYAEEMDPRRTNSD